MNATLVHRFRSPVLAALTIGAITFAVVTGLRGMGYLQSLELKALDWFFRIRPHPPSAPPRIAVIGITENDIQKIGQWPLTDAMLAEVIDKVSSHQPRAIGLDIYRDMPLPPGTDLLNSRLTANRRLIVVMSFGDEGVSPPLALENSDQVGFNDILPDPDGTVRRALLFLDDGETVFYSFALKLATLYLKREQIELKPDPTHPEHLRLESVTVRPFKKDDGSYVRADDRGYQFLMSYQKKNFPVFSLAELLSGDIDPIYMKDRIVLVGTMAQSVKDFFYIPLNQSFRYARPTPGVLLHAHIADQLVGFALDGHSPLKSFSNWQERLWILIWAITGGFIGCWLRSVPLFCAGGAMALFALFCAGYLFFLSHYWIPLLPPALACLAAAAVVASFMSDLEKRQRAVLMNLFSRHVSPEVAESIWLHRDEFMENGRPKPQELMITVLFSDLKGYTAVAEQLSPKALVDWLNSYLESMTRLVMAFGGVVDDYAGDGIKANFGVPIPRSTRGQIRKDAADAVHCALAMEAEMYRLNNRWARENLPRAGMRIGINTGPAVAGTIGNADRMKYTTIGDAVNVAARLESYDKALAANRLCRILLSEATMEFMDDKIKADLVGELYLKGKERKIKVFNLIDGEKSANPTTIKEKPP